MMKYKNMRTGATVETECSCAGADWKEVKPVRPPKPPEQEAALASKAAEASKAKPAPARKKTGTTKRTVKKDG